MERPVADEAAWAQIDLIGLKMFLVVNVLHRPFGRKKPASDKEEVKLRIFGEDSMRRKKPKCGLSIYDDPIIEGGKTFNLGCEIMRNRTACDSMAHEAMLMNFLELVEGAATGSMEIRIHSLEPASPQRPGPA